VVDGRGRYHRKMIHVRLVGLLVVVLCMGSCAEGGLPPVEFEGAHFLEAPVLELITTHVARVMEQPASAKRHGSLGLVYEANGIWPAARLSFARAHQLDPDESLWLLHQGIAAQLEGDVDAALELLAAAGEARPDDAATQHRLGVALFQSGAFAVAQRAFEAASAAAPQNPLPHLGLANVKMAQGNPAAAVNHAEACIERAPRLVGGHYALGTALLALSETERSTAELALGSGGSQKYMPSQLSAERASYAISSRQRMRAAQDHLDGGRAEAAAALLEPVVRDFPKKASSASQLAVAYIALERFDEARALVERAHASDPNYFLAYAVGAYCELEAGSLDAALASATRGVELAPRAVRTLRALGDVQMQREEYGAALTSFERALEQRPGDADVAERLGTVAALLGRFDIAERSFRRSLLITPRSLDAHLKLVGVFLRQHKLQSAREYLDLAAELAPNHPQVTRLMEAFEQAARKAGQ